jgi:outer membrane protein assembly factor BamE (lipoprotein component of BamABCDE complex)
MKTLLVLISVIVLSGCASGPRLTTTDLSNGMSRQEVLQKFGNPVNSTISNGTNYLVYEFHDHAYGRDDNAYALGFQNDRLVSVEPLPEDQQKMGPIDRALRQRSIKIEQMKP